MTAYKNMTKSFNQQFCWILQFHLTDTLGSEIYTKFERFWCDGVAMPFVDAQLIKGNLANTRRITTQAWMGFTGQEKYTMEIKFGPLSLQRCINDESLADCLPDSDSMDWITLDVTNKTIELRLK